MRQESRRFYRLRIHSLSGVLPVGLFVLLHSYTNSFSAKGPQAFDARLAALNGLPFMKAFEVLFIYLPIIFLAGFDIWITLRSKQNLSSYPLFGNLRYTLQRLSGIGVLLFVAAHVYKTRIEPWRGGYPWISPTCRRGCTSPSPLPFIPWESSAPPTTWPTGSGPSASLGGSR